MSSATAILGISAIKNPLRVKFFKWQCRVRQNAMRTADGRPDAAIMPRLTLPDTDVAMGQVITLINKLPGYSVTAEMEHMAQKTFDPAQRREQALRFFSSSYYQKPAEFSDILTATFPPQSVGAAAIRAAGSCTLFFEAYAQSFTLVCRVWRLVAPNPLHAATYAHNRLFNPALSPKAEVLGFEPNWDLSHADPGSG